MGFSKYAAKPTFVDGTRFDSKAEASRFCELKNLERAGVITGLELQPKFDISINGKHCFSWRGDFAYFEGQSRIIEDVKGYKTDVYRLKKKCVEAAYGFKILETGIKPKRTAKAERITREVKEVFRDAQRRAK